MHEKKIRTAGKKLSEASKALIMLHGRGATAEDILSLASHLHVNDYAIMAPQATNRTWYPYSFLVPPAQNEPWFSSALSLLSDVVEDIVTAGIPHDHIYFVGFSQGACLSLEFTTRHARKWGGIVAFTGGLIGDRIFPENYEGDFDGTPVFIGTSDPDPHVPLQRVLDSIAMLRMMGAAVTEKVYANMGHTVSRDEIEKANSIIFK